MDRSAPAAGYDFGTKRHYRKNVWNTFREHCRGRLDEAHVLLMPSAEGDEIDVALSKGFREYNLHVVDRNPAIVAHLKRRYPRINTYGVTVSAAARRIADAGVRLSAANLDLCSPLCDSLIGEVREFVVADALRNEGALVAVTMLRGREQGEANRSIQAPKIAPELAKNTDAVRLMCLKGSALQTYSDEPMVVKIWKQSYAKWRPATSNDGVVAGLIRYDSYRSAAGSQTMLWSIFKLWTRSFVWAECERNPHTLGDFAPPKQFEQWCNDFGVTAALMLLNGVATKALCHEANLAQSMNPCLELN